MKIGILTFYFANNYGAVLQAYALKSTLEDCGVEIVEIINYKGDNFDGAYEISPLTKQGLKNKAKALIKYPVNVIQYNKFKKFRTNKLGISETALQKIRGDYYDAIVVGSDQVWNLNITSNDFNYFLKDIDGDRVRCYSYAASSDNRFIERYQNKQIKGYLEKFKNISVREMQLKVVLNERLAVHSEVVLDPVLLCTTSFWRKIGVRPVKLPARYILYYGLTPDFELEETARKLRRETKLPIVVIHPMAQNVTNIGDLRYDIGPGEFVYLLDNADYIVSNSFHAFAFACVFSKTIFFNYMTGLSNRVASLIELLHLDIQKRGDTGASFISLNITTNEYFHEIYVKSHTFVRGIVTAKNNPLS